MEREFATNIDLDHVVTEFAWRDFRAAAEGDKKKRNLLKKHKKDPFIEVKVDWSKVNFVSSQDKWERMSSKEAKSTLSHLDMEKEAVGGEGEGATAAPLSPDIWLRTGEDKGLLPNKGRPDVNVLFQTKFINNSPGKNEYNLKVEKTTTSCCETSIESSYTKGCSFELALKTPGEVLEANAGFSREFTLTDTETETKEKSATWAVESKIEVPENKVAEAFLVVEEETYNGKFNIKTQVWGNVHIRFYDLRKPTEKQIWFTNEDITFLLEDFLTTERKKPGRGMSYSYVEIVTPTSSGKSKSTDGATGGATNNQAAQIDTKGENNVPKVEITTTPTPRPVKQPPGKHVRITTAGHCDFKFGICQEVLVNVIDLNKYLERQKAKAALS